MCTETVDQSCEFSCDTHSKCSFCCLFTFMEGALQFQMFGYLTIMLIHLISTLLISCLCCQIQCCIDNTQYTKAHSNFGLSHVLLYISSYKQRITFTFLLLVPSNTALYPSFWDCGNRVISHSSFIFGLSLTFSNLWVFDCYCNQERAQSSFKVKSNLKM